MNARSTTYLVVIWVAGLWVAAGCHGSLYTLPPPPPKDKQVSGGLTPGEEAQVKREEYLKARAALLKLYHLLSTQRYREAVGMLSQETRDFLAYGSKKKDPVDALASGELDFPSGRSVKFNPVDLLVAKHISKIVDSVKGATEHETSRRKALFVVLPDGSHRKVVMIKEGGKWVLQRTSIPKGLGANPK